MGEALAMPVVEHAGLYKIVPGPNKELTMCSVGSLRVPRFPALFRGLVLLASIRGSPGETLDLRIRFARPGEMIHLREMAHVSTLGPKPRTMVRVEIELPVDSPGAYEFRLGIHGEPPVHVPIMIEQTSVV